MTMVAADPRARLEALIVEHGVGYAALSRMLRRNDAYLQQYVRRGTPRILAERDRALLAAYFRIDQSELGGPPTPSMAAIRRLAVEASAGAGASVDPSDERDGARTMLLDPRLLADLRLASDAIGILHALIALDMADADFRTFEQIAQGSPSIDLSLMAAQCVNVGVEWRG